VVGTFGRLVRFYMPIKFPPKISEIRNNRRTIA
jgi:hypothetical protein